MALPGESLETLSRWTLCCQARGQEIGFLSSRKESLASGLFFGSLVLAFVFGANLVQLSLGGSEEIIDLSTQSAETQRKVVAVSSLHFALNVCIVIIYALSMLVAKCQPVLRWLGALGLERYIAVLLLFLPIFAPVKNLWVSFHLVGVEDPASVLANAPASYTDLHNSLLGYLTATHMVLPVRWVAFLPCEIAVLCSYVGPVLLFGSPLGWGHVASHSVIFLALIASITYGKRRMEYYERLTFQQLVAEKSARFQVEHRLESFAAHQSDVETDGGTSLTSKIFNRIRGHEANLRGALQDIGNLGSSEHWLIQSCDLQPVANRILGAGGMGIVVPAKHLGTPVVLKASRQPSNGTEGDHLKSLVDELRVLRHIRHPNIVLFQGAAIQPESNEIVLVLEYVRGVTLQQFVHGPVDNTRLPERCRLLSEIALALRYLHAQEPCIVHGDIKGSNVLVDLMTQDHPIAKLSDFGLSRLITGRERHLGGSLHWMPPEVFLQSRPPRPSADIFCFGRVLYLVMAGEKPLQKVTQREVQERARCGEVIPVHWPEGVLLLLKFQQVYNECTKFDPDARPDINEVHNIVVEWTDADVWSEAGFRLGPEEGGARIAASDMWDVLARAREVVNRIHYSKPDGNEASNGEFPDRRVTL